MYCPSDAKKPRLFLSEKINYAYFKYTIGGGVGIKGLSNFNAYGTYSKHFASSC